MSGRGTGTLVVDKVRRSFGSVRAIDAIDVTVEGGQFVTLLGPSGCGKTTLLRIIAGLDAPDAGSLVISGRDMTHTPPERRPVNYVFQSFALFPHLDLRGNVGFGLAVRGTPRAEADARIRETISIVRLDGLESRRVDQLSGGQQQRVALARAIVNRPDILLLDEPLGALDLKLRKEMQFELRQIHRKLRMTFIYVTHDQEEALTMSDRIIVMRDGAVVQDGAPEEIYRNPSCRFVAEFIGETNILEGVSTGRSVVLDSGIEFASRCEAVGPVSVSIRPEQLRVSPEAQDPAEGRVALRATFVDTIFVGSYYRHVVELNNGTLVTIQDASNGVAFPKAGSVVCVSWATDDAVVLTK